MTRFLQLTGCALRAVLDNARNRPPSAPFACSAPRAGGRQRQAVLGHHCWGVKLEIHGHGHVFGVFVGAARTGLWSTLFGEFNPVFRLALAPAPWGARP